MATTFTLHNLSDGQHWFHYRPYGTDQIEAIADPQGGQTVKQPTSIPSPFARIDLVRAAFQNLARFDDLRGPGTYNDERMVSDCFDVGEIFFNYEKLKDRLSITPWSPNTDLDRLVKSSNLGHKRLGEALKLFLDQDTATYNFNKIGRLFILKYKGKIVGGTSPSTLFFSSGNDLSWVDLRMGNDQLFDNSFAPLYVRDIEYQKYWYGLQEFMPGFRTYFKGVDDYLTKCKNLLERHNPKLFYEHIQDHQGNSLLTEVLFLELFDEMDTGQAGDVVEVLSYPLRKKKSDLDAIEGISDFIIRSSKYKQIYPNALLPMVLQNRFHRPFTYLPQTTWNPNVEVPYWVSEPYRDHQGKNERTLPGQPGKYPYLTVSDFLEPYLIQVPYPLNRDRFFDGNLSGGDNKTGYLLPLRKEFFDFFNIEDLDDGTVRLRMEARVGNSVHVTLEVPVRGLGQFITFERTYIVPISEGLLNEPDQSRNEGFIQKKTFTINLYPFIRSGGQSSHKISTSDYRLQLIEAGHDRFNKYEVSAIQQVKNVILTPDSEILRTERSPAVEGSSHYAVLNSEFEYIQVRIDADGYEMGGLLIPKWKRYTGGSKEFTFAVDFGTTNSHIEYKIGPSATPKPFDITKEFTQIGTLVAQDAYNAANTSLFELYFLFDQEFAPLVLGPTMADRFPTRTVLAERPQINFNNPAITLADFNIPFYVERQPAGQSELTRNLKWAKGNKENNRRVEAFVEELMLLIKNKVLLEGGSLSKTQIHWFYPASMAPGRIGQIRKLWRDLYRKHFVDPEAEMDVKELADQNVQELSESVGPFFFYKGQRKATAASRPAINVDIGGGTTDVVIYQNDSPQLLTSFRFAGNAIYGDAFSNSGASNSNGFVQKYQSRIDQLLDANNLSALKQTNAEILASKRSEDIIAFWFSLERGQEKKVKQLLSFNQMLGDDEDLKIVFLLFYVAILYHVAQLMKARKLELPGSITFSGTGSKLLTILTTENTLLREMSKLIFERVLELSYDQNNRLSVYADVECPKEATCRGALMMTASEKDTSPASVVFMGTVDRLTKPVTYSDLTNDRDNVSKAVLDEVSAFFAFFFSLDDEFSFADNLNISAYSLKMARQQLPVNLRDYLAEGINKKLEERQSEDTGQDRKVEEPLFFYPLIGAIHHLVSEIGQKTKLTN